MGGPLRKKFDGGVVERVNASGDALEYHLVAKHEESGKYRSVAVFDDPTRAKSIFFDEIVSTEDINPFDDPTVVEEPTIDLQGEPYSSLLDADWGVEVDLTVGEHPDPAEKHPSVVREMEQGGSEEEGV